MNAAADEDELTIEEKMKAIQIGVEYIMPILVKYNVTDQNAITAAVESFQAGVKFWDEARSKK